MGEYSAFGGRVKSIRLSKNLSQQQFADEMDVSRSYLGNIETGKKEPSFSFLLSLLGAYNVEPNWFFRGGDLPDLGNETEQSFARVGKFTVSKNADSGDSFVGSPMDVTEYAFRQDWLDSRGLDAQSLHIVEVKGDSMEPKLNGGDLILVDRAQTKPTDGALYVVRIWEELVVRHIQRISKDTISLISANKVYPAREVPMPTGDNHGADAEFAIIGRVVASMHEW